ncbi:MAG: cell division protein FtsZ [Alteromonas naphthalenivorans]|jgi:cell division protein FtsZ
MIEFDHEEEKQSAQLASIKVVGVGGAGGNTINCMVESGYTGIEFIAVNTDAQALKDSHAHVKLQIGQKSTKGLGAGANPEVGKRSAEEDMDKVMEHLQDADIVFVTGGMGGGTGSGALPVVVQALKEKGILTIVIVTKPFGFEGKKRTRIAEEAIKTIKDGADTLLIIPNQKLLDLVDDKVSMIDAFNMINEVLNQSVKGISDIITRAGHINVDFADVREIMKDQGLAVMGTARATGDHRAKKAALEAISSPLLENMSIAGARGVLLNITGGANLGLHEISEAASVIYEQADENANIILGSVIDKDAGDEVSVTVIATGFDESCQVNASSIPTAVRAEEHIEVADVSVQEDQYQATDVQEDSKVEEYKQEDQVLQPAQDSEELKAQAPQPQEIRKERVEVQQQAAEEQSGPVHINDLDVPTFMRKKGHHHNHKQHKND